MRKFFLQGPFFPSRRDNLMTNEGSVALARENFIRNRFRNLDFLLRSRYSWMSCYLGSAQTIIEVGSGAGLSSFYLNQRVILTDATQNPWLHRYLDATNMDLEDCSVDVFIASHCIHHFNSPFKFFEECERVLKPGGVLLIQEINTSTLMRLLLRLMRHEGWSYLVDVFSRDEIVSCKDDLWSANCAVPELLFASSVRFESAFRGFKIERNELCECLLFPLSGGVIAKTVMPELPNSLLKGVSLLDKLIVRLFPHIFALGRRVVLRKRG